MKKILYLLMVGLAFTLIQVSTAVANDCSAFTLGTPSYVSCAAQGAGPPPLTINDPACVGPLGETNPDCPNFVSGGHHDGPPPVCPEGTTCGPMTGGHHPPADCGGVPCPTGHDGGPDGHHPPTIASCPEGTTCGPMTGDHHDGPPIDPRTITDANPTGTPFTQADEAKYQVYADECESSAGLISPASLALLIADGFTTEQVNGLCQMSAHDGPPPGEQGDPCMEAPAGPDRAACYAAKN